jgi:hypothetical protein
LKQKKKITDMGEMKESLINLNWKDDGKNRCRPE